jgi:hypothetical protein
MMMTVSLDCRLRTILAALRLSSNRSCPLLGPLNLSITSACCTPLVVPSSLDQFQQPLHTTRHKSVPTDGPRADSCSHMGVLLVLPTVHTTIQQSQTAQCTWSASHTHTQCAVQSLL